MELTPTLLNEVEVRPEFRGYNRAEVDDFLERVAASVEQLLARLRDAEGGLAGSGNESITRTLVLAQRTADAAIHEA
jgi:DivIVA domain-containing protein